MNKSEQINELAAALCAFQGEVKSVVFDSSNPFFKSKYASLSALVRTAAPVLVKNGLAISQVMENETAVTTILMHKSGQYIESTLKLKPVKDDPQGIGSAITYARRYSFASILGLVSDEDDDGNAASHPAQPSYLEDSQLSILRDNLAAADIPEEKLCLYLKLEDLTKLPKSDYQKALAAIAARKKAKEMTVAK